MRLGTYWTRVGIFCGLALVLIISNTFFFYGHFGVDDMEYARLSYDLLQGKYDWANHYSYRLSILTMTALSYSLFGVNDFASSLPAIVLSLGIIYILFDLTKESSLNTIVITLGFYFCIKWNLFYADKLMPDIYVSAFIFLAWWSYYKIKFRDAEIMWSALFFSLGLFFAFLSKGTVILILPLFAFYFMKDIISRENKQFWINVIWIHVVLYLIYFGMHAYLTGDAFARIHAISANSYFNTCSYDQLPFAETIHRLTSGFYNFISAENLILFVIITVASLFMLTQSSMNSKFKYLLFTSIICIISANAMTISLTSYNPTCLDIRHYLLFLPILTYCGGQLIIYSLQQKSITVAIIILGLCVIQVLINFDTLSTGQLTPLVGLAILTGASFISQRVPKMICTAILFMALIYPSIQSMQYAKSLDYTSFKSEYTKLLTDMKDDTEIYTSHVAINLGEYFLQFNATSIHFKDIRKEAFTQNSQAKQILIKNWYCDWHSEIEENTYNEWLEYEELKAKLEEKSNKIIRVYRLEK